MKACMGGWCLERDWCPNYQLGGEAQDKRLCVPGRDGEGIDEIIRLSLPPSQWARRGKASAARPATWLGTLALPSSIATS